jgi:hypothetical protein
MNGFTAPATIYLPYEGDTVMIIAQETACRGDKEKAVPRRRKFLDTEEPVVLKINAHAHFH